jgi:hypothetical protein
MKTYQVWTGTRNWQDIDADSEVIIFEGEELGVWESNSGDYGVIYSVYRTEEGILIHEYEWIDDIDETRRGKVYEFETLEDAAREFRYVLQMAGVIE